MGEKRRVFGTVGGAVGLGGFAAALGFCCTAPWAVALLGVSGAVVLARMTFLLPYVLIGSAALLGVGFWLAYRRPAGCADETCAPTSRRAMQWVVWIAAVIVAGMVIVALKARVMA